MERSPSQKALKVLSILTIVLGALGIIASLMAVFAGSVLSSVGPADLADAGYELEDAAMAGTAMGVVGAIALSSALVSIVEGILGLRAAADNRKVIPLWFITLISFAMAVVSTVMAIIQGQFAGNAWNYLLSLASSGLMFWLANNVKVEAGR